MIYDGALAANGVLHTGAWIWCLVIGVLIILWILIGITNLGKINTVAMAAPATFKAGSGPIPKMSAGSRRKLIANPTVVTLKVTILFPIAVKSPEKI